VPSLCRCGPTRRVIQLSKSVRPSNGPGFRCVDQASCRCGAHSLPPPLPDQQLASHPPLQRRRGAPLAAAPKFSCAPCRSLRTGWLRPITATFQACRLLAVAGNPVVFVVESMRLLALRPLENIPLKRNERRQASIKYVGHSRWMVGGRNEQQSHWRFCFQGPLSLRRSRWLHLATPLPAC